MESKIFQLGGVIYTVLRKILEFKLFESSFPSIHGVYLPSYDFFLPILGLRTPIFILLVGTSKILNVKRVRKPFV